MTNTNLDELINIPSVTGVVLCSRAGDVLEYRLPHAFTEEDMAELGQVMVESRSGVVASLGRVEVGDFRYAEHRVLIYYFSKGELLLLCDPVVNVEEVTPQVLAMKDSLGALIGARQLQRNQGVCKSAKKLKKVPAVQVDKIESKRSTFLISVLVALCIVIVGAFYWLGSQQAVVVNAEVVGGKKEAALVDVNTLVPRNLINLHGSNTIGAKLAPELAKKYLRKIGANKIWLKPGAQSDEQQVLGFLPGDDLVSISIQAHGSSTSFRGLNAEQCDIGMASRRVKDTEVVQLERFGDMYSVACEHILAMDGIAVIVNPANDTNQLTMLQIAKLFSGEINDWSQLEQSGLSGPVQVFARDGNSGTWDTFKNIILKPNKLSLSENAARIEDSRVLTQQVADNTNAIGFIGLPYISPAKAISVAAQGAKAVYPTPFTVATEDYPLARRLYLYMAAIPEGDHIRSFVEFSLSEPGQQVVADVGFIKLTIGEQPVQLPESAPEEYLQATRHAKRLSVTYRFKTGHIELDNRGNRDLDRLVKFMQQGNNQYRSLRLIGFADNVGDAQQNMSLSQLRAQEISDQLISRGITPQVVLGVGEAMPVADNTTNSGRKKNRRVELWLSDV